MIELDYNNESELIKFVEKSEYFDKPLNSHKEAFEKSRPKVESVDKIQNKSTNIQTNIDVLTIHFSQIMDTRFRNFQLGPLGEKNVIRIKNFQGFSEDEKSVSFGIEKLEPSKKYQIVVDSGFRNAEGIPLTPYLTEFQITEQQTPAHNNSNRGTSLYLYKNRYKNKPFLGLLFFIDFLKTKMNCT